MLLPTTFGISASPGANSKLVLYDDFEIPELTSGLDVRVVTAAFLDQNFAINVWWAKDKLPGSVLRLRDSTSYTNTSVKAQKPITVVAVASLANNDRFTVTLTVTRNGVVESTTAKTFEYQIDGDFVAGAGRTTIDVQAIATDVEVAVLTASTVVTAFAGALQAAEPTTATLTLESTVSGAAYVITAAETVTNAGFTPGAAVVGVDGSIVFSNVVKRPGRNVIVLDTGTAPTEFDVRVGTYNSYEPGV